MLVHSVFFWLKSDLTNEQVSAFREGLESLKKIESAHACYIGTPADTERRPVIESSYSYALTVIFDTLSDHDKYQVHPVHKRFIESHKGDWERVLIYDAD